MKFCYAKTKEKALRKEFEDRDNYWNRVSQVMKDFGIYPKRM